MAAYYNEIDAYAAQWLRNLIDAGHIAPGDVDERSIVDVRPDDLRGYEQCHFFAGIGGWSLALRLAGWPDDRPVWTGSCPCQPFSAAGAGKAADDERHLWPRWFPLIAERRPAIVFGEQVEAAIGWGWLDAVFADMEGEGYACGAAVLPACGVGAPHIRQRVWFVADADGRGCDGARLHVPERRPQQTVPDIAGASADSALADAKRGATERWRHDVAGAAGRTQDEARQREWLRPDTGAGSEPRILAHADGRDASAEGLQRGGQHGQWAQDRGALQLAVAEGEQFDRRGDARRGRGQSSDGRGMGDASGAGLQERERDERVQREAMGPQPGQAIVSGSDACGLGHANGEREDTERGIRSGPAIERARSPWANLDWLPCTDGKARPVEPGTFPLAHGIPGRVGRLRAFGNAIVPQVAAGFIHAADR